MHPAVAAARAQFLERVAARGRRLAVVDIPLLFETGGESKVDLVLVVSAPEAVQRARALKRGGMTEAKLAAVLSRQTPDVDKRRRAHFVIDTSGSLAQTRAAVAQFVRALSSVAEGGTRHA